MISGLRNQVLDKERLPTTNTITSVTSREIRAVRMLAGKGDLPFEQKEGEVRFTVPCVETYEIVVITY